MKLIESLWDIDVLSSSDLELKEVEQEFKQWKIKSKDFRQFCDSVDKKQYPTQLNYHEIDNLRRWLSARYNPESELYKYARLFELNQLLFYGPHLTTPKTALVIDFWPHFKQYVDQKIPGATNLPGQGSENADAQRPQLSEEFMSLLRTRVLCGKAQNMLNAVELELSMPSGAKDTASTNISGDADSSDKQPPQKKMRLGVHGYFWKPETSIQPLQHERYHVCTGAKLGQIKKLFGPYVFEAVKASLLYAKEKSSRVEQGEESSVKEEDTITFSFYSYYPKELRNDGYFIIASSAQHIGGLTKELGMRPVIPKRNDNGSCKQDIRNVEEH